jgi:hypothetical protein
MKLKLNKAAARYLCIINRSNLHWYLTTLNKFYGDITCNKVIRFTRRMQMEKLANTWFKLMSQHSRERTQTFTNSFNQDASSKCWFRARIAYLTGENPRGWQHYHPVYHNWIPLKYSAIRSQASQSLKNEPISFGACVRLSVYLHVATQEPLKKFLLNLISGDGTTTICRKIIVFVQLQRMDNIHEDLHAFLLVSLVFYSLIFISAKGV